MTVYVDAVQTYPDEAIKDSHTRSNGRRWSHMWADSEEELKEFAVSIGLKLEWFQNRPRFPHFDITPSKRVLALRSGAVEKSLRDAIRERD